ncbi:hypothetical protein MAR_015985 [Mya arenaria]|uniref:Uncharacterized protein n=1 Tax=Mya arenaria TaxID=6604 RepID=A0ABY7FMP1_MYAAR|nr:hypothetical protein MAR_015985 [Mya arenaria]
MFEPYCLELVNRFGSVTRKESLTISSYTEDFSVKTSIINYHFPGSCLLVIIHKKVDMCTSGYNKRHHFLYNLKYPLSRFTSGTRARFSLYGDFCFFYNLDPTP